MADTKDQLTVLGKAGVNVVSIGEEAFYAWNTSPDIIKELDTLFKENNCSFTGSGYQDVYKGYLAIALVGSAHKVTKLECFVQYNVDDYGVAVAEL